LEEELNREYRRMIDRWEKGDLYYHFREFVKRTSFPERQRYKISKKYISAVLALARLGFPITSATLGWILDSDLTRCEAICKHLCSIKVLTPLKSIGRHDMKAFSSRFKPMRYFKLTREFIRQVYTKLDGR